MATLPRPGPRHIALAAIVEGSRGASGRYSLRATTLGLSLSTMTAPPMRLLPRKSASLARTSLSAAGCLASRRKRVPLVIGSRAILLVSVLVQLIIVVGLVKDTLSDQKLTSASSLEVSGLPPSLPSFYLLALSAVPHAVFSRLNGSAGTSWLWVSIRGGASPGHVRCRPGA